MTVTINGRAVPTPGNPFAAAVEEELRKSAAGPSQRGARVTYGPPKGMPNVSVIYSAKPPNAAEPRVHITYGANPRTKVTAAPRRSTPSREPALVALRQILAGRAPVAKLAAVRQALEGKTPRPALVRPQPRARATTDSQKGSAVRRETRTCPTCQGRGYVNPKRPGVACPTCGGRGYVIPTEAKQDQSTPPNKTTGLPAAKEGKGKKVSTTTTTIAADARRRNPAVARLVDRAADEGARRGLKDAKKKAKKAKKKAKRAQRAAEQATALIKMAYGNGGDVTPEQMWAAVDHPGGDPRAVLAAIAALKRRMASEKDEVRKAELGNMVTLLALREQWRGRVR